MLFANSAVSNAVRKCAMYDSKIIEAVIHINIALEEY